MGKTSGLSPSMTEAEFHNGYWYAVELKAFARELGIPSASKLRKNELESAIVHFLRTGEVQDATKRALSNHAQRDVERGLSLKLPVVNYINDKETKAFILNEAQKRVPNFQHKSGTRYQLNRWREEQIIQGRKITYADVVAQAIALNEQKTGPLRTTHGRYNNFTSDFMAANEGATQRDVAKAWGALKKLDVPKTYEDWVRVTKNRRR